MTDFAYTRCPGCGTVFRVTAGQLALREGQVRCGQCRAVFDANDHRVKPPAGDATPPQEDVDERPGTPATEGVAAHDEPASIEAPRGEGEPPREQAETPREEVEALREEAERPREEAATPREEAASREEVETTGEAGEAPRAEDQALAPSESSLHDEAPLAATAPAALPPPRDYEWRPRKRVRERSRALHAFALVALVALLGAQLLFEYRDALAAHAPVTRPLLEAACRLAQCAIAPLRDASALSIEASDLQADPAHKGLLKLTATVRNRAAYAIAYPYLELTLTDAADTVVARRAFAPAVYAPARDGGIAANGEFPVTMFLDASATSQAGYRLYLFYP